MTPAIQALDKAKITYKLHTYTHDPAVTNFGREAAEALQTAPERIFKTLLASLSGGGWAVGIVPVLRELDLKALAASMGAKKASMAEPQKAERLTGYVVGGISPLGQKKRLPTCIDRSALTWPTIFVSGGKRGLDIELAPDNLLALTQGQVADLAR